MAGTNDSRKDGDGNLVTRSGPEAIGRRHAMLLGSIGAAGAVLGRGTAAPAAAVPEATFEQAFDPSVANRISSLAKRVTVNGLSIEYEIIGKGDPVAITPGGRFTKETPGVRELAEALAAGGKQVLIWDRPNCGGSDVSFDAQTESRLSADTLAGLLRTLGMGPAMLVGGSAGSRVSLLTAEHHPNAVSRLFIFWISGGPIGLATLTMTYCAPSAMAAMRGGMEAVAALPDWAESIRRNPGNRARILSQDPARFIETMQRWGGSFFPTPGSPVPGMTPESFRGIRVPTMVLRSGQSDLHHTRKTSEDVHARITGATLAEPPWPDNEWNMRGVARATKGEGLFQNWPKLAPQILAFAQRT
jgi:pimeloyl-ACP methyl ester carboxylesterase